MNSNFDEQKIDTTTHYAKPDNGDDDLTAERGDKVGKVIVDDLYKSFWGVNPSTLPPEFYTGATVTIKKKPETDEDFELTPWTQIDEGIDEGDQDAINAGNRELLSREQTEVVLPAYNIIRGSVPAGSPRTVFNWFAKNPMPGGPPIQNVVQNGDITDTDDRWEWIDNGSAGMLAIWNGTSNATYYPSFDAAKRKTLVEKDLRQAVIDGQYLNYAIDVP